MKIELSEDQNTLTVDGMEFQARPTFGASCDDCYFNTRPGCNLSGAGMKRGCTPFPGGRGRKGTFVVWIKKENDMNEETKGPMNYRELNKEALSEYENNANLKLWWHRNGGWTTTSYMGFNYLHFASEQKPNWNPELLTKEQIQTMMPHFDDIKIWRLDLDRFVEVVGTNAYLMSGEYCYLLNKNKPKFHPTQKKIAKLILGRNKMQEEVKEVKPHVHCDMMIAYAKNPTLKIFVWYKDDWQKLSSAPIWDPKKIYAIGEKPTEPPVRMVTYMGGTIEFPLPVLYRLPTGTSYFFVTTHGLFNQDGWVGSILDSQRSKNGVIHLHQESARAHQKALNEFLQNQANSWVASA